MKNVFIAVVVYALTGRGNKLEEDRVREIKPEKVEIIGKNGDTRIVCSMGKQCKKNGMLLVRDGSSVFAVKKWRYV